MQITAYDTKDRRTLQLWSKGSGAFEVLRVVQEFPYPIAEVRMLDRQSDTLEASDDEEAAAVREACADLFVEALDVNLERLVSLSSDLEKLVKTRTREDVVNENLDVLAAFLLRKTPSASLAYLSSTSRTERLEILSKAAAQAKEVVGLGFDYLRKQQVQGFFQRGLLFLVLSFFVGLIVGSQTQQVDSLL